MLVSLRGEKKRCKTIDTKKDGADGSGQPLCVCFAYLRQICCLVSGTEGSPLTNWGCFWEIQTRVCNIHGQLLGVYTGFFLSLSLSLSLFLSVSLYFSSVRPKRVLVFFSDFSLLVPSNASLSLSSSGPRKTWSTFPGSPTLTFSWTMGKSTVLLDSRKLRMVIYFGRQTSNVMCRSIHRRIYCRWSLPRSERYISVVLARDNLHSKY